MQTASKKAKYWRKKAKPFFWCQQPLKKAKFVKFGVKKANLATLSSAQCSYHSTIVPINHSITLHSPTGFCVRGKQMIACKQIWATMITTVRPRLSEYFVSSKNASLARYVENQNQTCSHGWHSGVIPPIFFELLQILLCQENFLLKNIIKTKVLIP